MLITSLSRREGSEASLSAIQKALGFLPAVQQAVRGLVSASVTPVLTHPIFSSDLVRFERLACITQSYLMSLHGRLVAHESCNRRSRLLCSRCLQQSCTQWYVCPVMGNNCTHIAFWLNNAAAAACYAFSAPAAASTGAWLRFATAMTFCSFSRSNSSSCFAPAAAFPPSASLLLAFLRLGLSLSADTLPLLSPTSRTGKRGLNATRVSRAFLTHCSNNERPRQRRWAQPAGQTCGCTSITVWLAAVYQLNSTPS